MSKGWTGKIHAKFESTNTSLLEGKFQSFGQGPEKVPGVRYRVSRTGAGCQVLGADAEATTSYPTPDTRHPELETRNPKPETRSFLSSRHGFAGNLLIEHCCVVNKRRHDRRSLLHVIRLNAVKDILV